MKNAVQIELHGFSDASVGAFGCVIYAKSVNSKGVCSVVLVTAKSKVAPLKTDSLPRLELKGAVLLAQAMNRIKRNLNVKITDEFLWTDSTIVLNWLSSHSSRWLPLVANRVSLIQRYTSHSNWLKVQSKDNPADIVSRGMLPSELVKSTLWHELKLVHLKILFLLVLL